MDKEYEAKEFINVPMALRENQGQKMRNGHFKKSSSLDARPKCTSMNKIMDLGR